MYYLFLTLLVVLLSINTAFAYECFYAAKDSQSEMVSHGDCVENFEDGIPVLKEKHFNNFDFSSEGLSYFFLMENKSSKVFFVSREGVIMQTHNFDNGPDYFVEGKARMVRNGKYGFVNQKLDVEIRPEYDFAYPFENGYSIVCNGCEEKPDGEHQILTGGSWGLIDKEGRIVIPITLKRSELGKRVSEKNY